MTTLAKRLSMLAGALGLAAGVAAQDLSGELSPNPAAPGEPVAFTITDATGQGLTLSSPCSFFTIHQGAQDGPDVGLSVACPAVLVGVEPHGSYGFTWDQRDRDGNLVPPGRYWFQAQAWEPGFGRLLTEWFCLSIQGPDEPALRAAGPARVGETTPMKLSSTADAGAPYLAALSLSSNDPVSAFGLETCLSLPVFVTFLVHPFGFLDASGQSDLAVQVPDIPQIRSLGFHVQALVAGRVWRMTNDLSFSIRP